MNNHNYNENRKRIFLIRHGQTSHNQEGYLLSGISDISLTDEGIKECNELSAFFKYHSIERVYVSPLKRAIESAKYIFPNFKNDFIVNDSLIEINYGEYEGNDQFNESEDLILKQWHNAPSNLTFPSGDNIRNHAQKSFKKFRQLITNCNKNNIACISHKTTIRLIIAQIINLELDFFRAIPCTNCSINELEYSTDKSFNIITLNTTLKYISNHMKKD